MQSAHESFYQTLSDLHLQYIFFKLWMISPKVIFSIPASKNLGKIPGPKLNSLVRSFSVHP